MKKITTYFKKDPNNLGLVINEIDPNNEWVLKESTKATKKYENLLLISTFLSLDFDGTYELCGPKIQGNPENLSVHQFVRHGSFIYGSLKDKSYEGIKEFFKYKDIEGIVFYGENGEMCKIRKKDFGMRRKIK